MVYILDGVSGYKNKLRSDGTSGQTGTAVRRDQRSGGTSDQVGPAASGLDSSLLAGGWGMGDGYGQGRTTDGF